MVVIQFMLDAAKYCSPRVVNQFSHEPNRCIRMRQRLNDTYLHGLPMWLHVGLAITSPLTPGKPDTFVSGRVLPCKIKWLKQQEIYKCRRRRICQILPASQLNRPKLVMWTVGPPIPAHLDRMQFDFKLSGWPEDTSDLEASPKYVTERLRIRFVHIGTMDNSGRAIFCRPLLEAVAKLDIVVDGSSGGCP